MVVSFNSNLNPYLDLFIGEICGDFSFASLSQIQIHLVVVHKFSYSVTIFLAGATVDFKSLVELKTVKFIKKFESSSDYLM